MKSVRTDWRERDLGEEDVGSGLLGAAAGRGHRRAIPSKSTRRYGTSHAMIEDRLHAISICLVLMQPSCSRPSTQHPRDLLRQLSATSA